MTVRILSFTDAGFRTAQRIAELTGGEASRSAADGVTLADWTGAAFAAASALIYVGAAGIAVRAIAPHLRGKAMDPAVLVVDEQARFVIPILSGHLGGANALALSLAQALGAQPVVTTATDLNGVFAVDVWAKAQGCAIPQPERIRTVSARLLRGEAVRFFSEFPVKGTPPAHVEPGTAENCDFSLSVHRSAPGALSCVPKIVVLGAGCRKGISAEALEAAFARFLEQNALWAESVVRVCTIDRKLDEPGLLEFCRNHGWPLSGFSAQELQQVKGRFSSSAFVEETVGVDNVCERCAVLGSAGTLLISKTAYCGTTFAAARADFQPEWS